ncbi:MAG TPA: DinB family protein [Cyclobacteriaceae bacterium]|jgi:uncharacterized damage-inducible protein DinB
MKDEFDRLVKLTGAVYDGEPWYGPSVKSILSDLTEDHRVLRTGESHSINELIFHMVAWRNMIAQTLEGNNEYVVSDEENFKPHANKYSLKEATEALEMSQVLLLKALSTFDADKLQEKVPGKKYSYYQLIQGIIHHDVYHAGQISLLKKKIQSN